MLAALLVAAVAVLFAGIAVAAALGALGVTASDGAHARARAAAQSGVAFGLHRVSWVLAAPSATLRCDVASCSSDVKLESVEAVSLGWPLAARLVCVTGEAAWGRATARAVSLVLLAPTATPRGLSVAEDADLQAGVRVSGCGLYVGGSLRGRENATFVAPDGEQEPAGPASDHAWGGRWPAAGVHAGGGIWTAGSEIHDVDPAASAYAADTDTHATSTVPAPAGPWAGPDLAAMVELPDVAWLASARAHALDPADAFADGVLHLDRLPPALPTGEPGSAEVAGFADQAAGYLVFVPADAVGGTVNVTGIRDPAYAPVTVVVEGDACLGAVSVLAPPLPDGLPAVSFSGALVVTGRLEVAATSAVSGHLACRRLLVAAPLAVSLDAGWRERPPIGSLEPVLVARE